MTPCRTPVHPFDPDGLRDRWGPPPPPARTTDLFHSHPEIRSAGTATVALPTPNWPVVPCLLKTRRRRRFVTALAAAVRLPSHCHPAVVSWRLTEFLRQGIVDLGVWVHTTPSARPLIG